MQLSGGHAAKSPDQQSKSRAARARGEVGEHTGPAARTSSTLHSCFTWSNWLTCEERSLATALSAESGLEGAGSGPSPGGVGVREGVEFEAAPNVSVLRERDRRWRRRHVALPAEVTSAL